MENIAPLDTSIDQDDARFANVAPLSDDWYHGHKVVAMPSSSFGGKTIREVVSSRNEHDRPRRSSSLGRQPMAGGERRDLVQDVYDRMGVSYSRSMAYESNNNNNNNYNNNYAPSGYEQQQQQDTPLAIHSHPSFSDSIASSITNSVHPPQQQQQQQQYVSSNTGGGKMKDKFSGRYRAAAAVSAVTRAGDRGRARTPVVEESEGQKRARSLSRGRSVKGTWPPSREQAVANANAELYGSTNPAGSTTSELSTPPSPERRTGSGAAAPKRSHSFDARPQYGRGRTGSGFRSPGSASGSNNNNSASHKYQPNPQSYTNNRMRIASPLPGDFIGNNNNKQADNNSMRDEKKESDEVSQSTSGEGEDAVPTIPSIKDRISAFAGPAVKKASTGGQRNSRRNTYGGPSSTGYVKSPPPPKVDIYEQSNRKHDEGYSGHPDDPNNGFDSHENKGEDGYSQGPPEASSIPPSAAAAAAADAATKYMRPSQTKKSHRVSTGGGTGASGVRAGSSLASSYLTGINSPGGTTSSRPVFQHPTGSGSFGGEVPFGASEEGPDGPGSVGANSAVSYGDASASRKSSQPWQKPSGSYNNNIRNTSSMVSSGNSPSHNSHTGGTMAVSPEMIEKMVDERVQVQLREVEARMEGLLRRWMDQMNTKITNRLDSMESSIKDSMPDPYRRHDL